MTNKEKTRPKHLLCLAGVIAVGGLLNACNTNELGPGPDPTPGSSFTALVEGPLDGPVYDLLKDQISSDQHDGTQNPASYDLVIIDGDHYTPDELAEDELVQKAFNASTWLLILDATYEHKKVGLLPSVGFATKGDTEAYVVRRQQDTPATQPQYRILELSSEGATAGAASSGVGMVGGNDLAVQQDGSVEQERRRGFVEGVTDSLSDNSIACEIPQLEAGIIAASYCYTPSMESGNSFPTTTGRVLTETTSTPAQDPSFVPNFGFTLLLSNGDDVTGDYQLLYATADVESDPATAAAPPSYAEQFPNEPYFQGWSANVNKNILDNGWFQSQVDIEFDAGDTDTWNPLTYAPQNLDPKVSYTYSSGSSFSLGFDSNPFDFGGDDDASSAELEPLDYATYTYDTSTSKSYTVTDWALEATNTAGSGANFQWQFYSQNPNSQDYNSNAWWGDATPNPKAQNILSKDILSVGASAVWQIPPDCTDPTDQATCSAQTGTVTFDGITATYYLTDLYCNIQPANNTSEVLVACDISDDKARGIDTMTIPYSMLDIEFDLGVLTPVTPVPGSLTFTAANGNSPAEGEPFSAGQCIEATFQLSGETPYQYTDVGVATQTSVTNAFVAQTPVDIPESATEGTFFIGTNDNNLASGETLNIQVSVKSVGQTLTSQFAIENDGGGTEACPPS